MTAQPETRHPFLTGASLAGAEAFAITFAVAGMLLRFLSLNVSEFNLGLALSTLVFAAAGGMGAAYLAAESQWRAHAVLFALAGFLGVGGGYLATTLLISLRVEPETATPIFLQAVHLAQFAVIGGLTGLLLGIAVGNLRLLFWLVVMGAIGFAVGYLVQNSLIDLLAEPLSDFISRFTQRDAIHAIAASLLAGLGGAVGGLLIGGALGWALER